MKAEQSNKILSSLITIILGVLLIIYRAGFVSIAITVFGVVLIILGAIDLANKKDNNVAIVKIILGILFVVFAWAFTKIAFIILGVLLILYGCLIIYGYAKSKTKFANFLPNLIIYANGLVLIIAGVCCFFAYTLDKMFIIVGVILIVDGILGLLTIKK